MHRELDPPSSLFDRCFRTVTLSLLLLPAFSATADTSRPVMVEMRPAQMLMTPQQRAEIGRTLVVPEVRALSRAPSRASRCRTSCDAFVTRQAVLSLEWKRDTADAHLRRAGQEPRLRLDISGTASGFAEGNYSSVSFGHVPRMEGVVLDPASPMVTARGEVLLNRVRNNRVVERRGDLPVYFSPNLMSRGMGRLEPGIRAALEEDLRSGGLSQVRVLGRAETPLRGKPHGVVTMVGLQPGATYRLRMVDEEARGGKVLEQICRIPVCPADFIDAD